MASYDTLTSAVVAITNRPDLIVEMRTAIRKAIFRFHGKDTFKRDILTTTLDMSLYPATNFRWEIDVTNGTVFPRFRRPAFLRIPPGLYDGQANPPPYDYPWGYPLKTQFVERDPTDIIDSYGKEFTNYYYLTGSILNLRTTFVPTKMELGYYSWPLFSVSSEGAVSITSWIADQFPDAIAEEAAGTVFRMIGKDEEFNRYAAFFDDNLSIVRATDVGGEV